MRIDVLTLFPKMFEGVLGASILKRAAEAVPDPKDRSVIRPPVVSYHLHDIRAYSTNKHGSVDDSSAGGGPGMVIQCQPVWDCVTAVEAMDERRATRIVLTPQGMLLSQKVVEQLTQHPRLLLIAGHYEGFDERVIQRLAPVEISIGDYVLSGGELPAMVLIDAIVRLLPGVVGDAASVEHESFSVAAEGLLDHPHYTRPRMWMEMPIPEVLLSGDHAKIAAWRREQAKKRTAERRPDLM
ncbi:MAG: tRNA (guanosine(37)-N1)-methyltransferase TrmD [Phycisphaeraceae bacterium]